jgi:hypothetical protein
MVQFKIEQLNQQKSQQNQSGEGTFSKVAKKVVKDSKALPSAGDKRSHTEMTKTSETTKNASHQNGSVRKEKSVKKQSKEEVSSETSDEE